MRRTFLFVTISFLAGLGIGLFARSARTHYSALAPLKSLAVLPLENLSGDRKQDDFAKGVTEALTTELTKISPLRVTSWQSVMQYKGTKRPASQIANELKVDSVVEGGRYPCGQPGAHHCATNPRAHEPALVGQQLPGGTTGHSALTERSCPRHCE